MFPPRISRMGTVRSWVSVKDTVQYPPWLLVFFFLASLSFSLSQGGRGVPVTRSIWQIMGLPSGALHMEDILSKFAMIYFLLQTLLFLALLISSVCWATSDVFDPALHHKQWSSRPRDCLAWIEFSSSWCLQRPFSLCLGNGLFAIAGGVQSLPPLCHTLQYSNNFFWGWGFLSCMNRVVRSWQGLLKLGFVL